MAFNSKKDSTSGGTKIYYKGVENVKLTCINPTLAELNEMGFTTTEVPVYVGKDDKGNQQVRIVCFTDNADAGKPFKSNIAFYIRNTQKVSSKGTVQYINKFGDVAYLPKDGTIPENMKWYRTDGMRPALDGEEFFVNMVRNYLNVPKDQDCFLENPAKLFTGDFSEIKSIPETGGNNKVGVLWGIKKVEGSEGTKYYQNAYNRMFMRQYAKVNTTGAKGSYEYLAESLNEYKANGGAGSVDYGNYPFTFTKVEDPANTAVSATPDADGLPWS